MKKRSKASQKTRSTKPKKKAEVRGGVLSFRWLKKLLLGKSQAESMDLLDEWILKKRTMSLFFISL